MRYKRSVLFLATVMVLFVAVNFAIWKIWTEDLLTDVHFQGGDLSRMGYISGSKDYRKTSVDLPRRHIEMKDYTGQRIDLVTIGDSFSNGGGGGRNPFYQDYLASISDCTVLNLAHYHGIDNITVLSMLVNNGYLERVRPKYVLLEATEKFCIGDLAHAIKFNATMSPAEMAGLKRIEYGKKLPAVGFINEGNFKFLLYSLLYNFSDHAFMGKVYVKDLRIPFFSVKDARKLTFLRVDFKNIPLATAESVGLVNDNLNLLADKLSQMGIKLYFMPCVDKYDLYREYLVNNRYPASTLFELLRKLPKRYEFIDTKTILAEELKKGEKDVYYADDTHWSWKASKVIFEKTRFDR